MTHPVPDIPVRPFRTALSVALVLVAAGCADAPSPATAGALRSLDVSFLDPGGMPHLSPAGDGAILSWWAPLAEGHALRAVAWTPDAGFGEVRQVVEGTDFFVNWADFPSVVEVASGKWVAHWLQRSGEGTFAYGIRVAVSEDAGGTWSEPWTPHEDGSPTEHGFVSVWPEGGGAWSLVWLDGRKYAAGPHGDATDEMTIRARSVAADGTPGAEVVLDHRGCDCCQTDAAMTARGPAVVYRDRTQDEVRDIYLVRRGEGGWTEGHPVHRDEWVIAACPVNGPAVAASGERLVVAWFTGAQETPRVQLAFSSDSGDSFDAPVRVDDGRPVGRVDAVLLEDGNALVSWLEETGEGAEVRIREVTPEGAMDPPRALAGTSAARASGFPQFVPLAGGDFLIAWTEVRPDGPSRIHLSLLEGS